MTVRFLKFAIPVLILTAVEIVQVKTQIFLPSFSSKLMEITPPETAFFSSEEHLPDVSSALSNSGLTNFKIPIPYPQPPELMSDEELESFPYDEFWNYIKSQEESERHFITEEEKKHLHIGFKEWETKLLLRGWIDIHMSYTAYRKDENFPHTPYGLRPQGFQLGQTMKVSLKGKIGKNLSVQIDHDSRRRDNTYKIEYKRKKDEKGFIRNVIAGNVSLTIPGSRYVNYTGTGKEAYGVKLIADKGPFHLEAVGSLTKSQIGYKRFTAGGTHSVHYVMDISYIKRKYYILPDSNLDVSSVEVYLSTSETNSADLEANGLFFVRKVSGKDFFLDAERGEIEFTSSLSRDTTAIIHYTHSGGSQISETNTNYVLWIGSKKFLYLRKADENYSPYEHKGVYSVGEKNFDPVRGFSLKVVYTADKNTQADLQFSPSDYELNPVLGIIRFNSKEPFPDPTGELYRGADDPVVEESEYTMVFEVFTRRSTFQLDFNIVPGSDEVRVNGVKLSSSDYYIIYQTGTLYITRPLNENDVIEVSYEYKPFWGGSQKLAFGARGVYKPTNSFYSIGSTLVYSVAQKPEGAPYVSSTPNSRILFDIDGNIDIKKMLGVKSSPFSASVSGEIAVSYDDPNSVDYAIVEDMEGASRGYSLTKNENAWYLSSPSTNIPGIYYTNRGKLLYKDYREYDINLHYELKHYDWDEIPSDQIKDYADKPGPYLVSGGHLDPTEFPEVFQTSLVLDYDFRSGGNWVGIITPIGGFAGVDLSKINEIYISCKGQSDEDGDNVYNDELNNNEVEIYIEIGRLNEDLDGDGVLDYEYTRNQPGFDFNNPTNHSAVETHIGRGRLGEGNGRVDTEDLNKNGSLDTNESAVTFPSPDTTYITNLTVSGDGWHQFELKIKSLSPEQISILQHATAIRIIIKKKKGSKGRILFDSIQLRSSSWRDTYVDGVLIRNAEQIHVKTVSVHDNLSYSLHRFYDVEDESDDAVERVDTFETLHGRRTTVEAMEYNEKALSIEYSLSSNFIATNFTPPLYGKTALVRRNFVSAQDYSRYRKLNFYFFIRSKYDDGSSVKPAGDTYKDEKLVFKVATDEHRYYLWKIPLDRFEGMKWHKVEINLKDSDMKAVVRGQSFAVEKEGFPALKDIHFIDVGVTVDGTDEPTNVGEVWVNEIYLSDDEADLGTAGTLRGQVGYNADVLKFRKFPLFSNPQFTWEVERKNVGFRGVGSNADERLDRYSVSFSSKLFKFATFSLGWSWLKNKSTDDEVRVPVFMRWENEMQNFNANISVAPFWKWFPALTHRFTQSFAKSVRNSLAGSSTNLFVQRNENRTMSFGTSIVGSGSLPFHFTHSFNFSSTHYLRDVSQFTNEAVITNSQTFGTENRNTRASFQLNWRWKDYSFGFNYDRTEDWFVKEYSLEGFRDRIDELVMSGPAVNYQNSVKGLFEGFKARGNPNTLSGSARFSLGIQRILKVLSFNYTASVNRRDYNFREVGTSPVKDMEVKISSSLKLPISLWGSFIRSVSPSWSREVSVVFYEVPYSTSWTNVFDGLKGILWDSPFKFQGILGNKFRAEALGLVDVMKSQGYRNQVSLKNSMGLNITIARLFRSEWSKLIPETYGFNYSLTTSRNVSSYLQGDSFSFSTGMAVPLKKIGGIFKTEGERKVDDLGLSFTYGHTRNFNTLTGGHSISLNGNTGYRWTSEKNLTVSYSYTRTVEHWLHNPEEFESGRGIGVGVSRNRALKSEDWHRLNLIYNWTAELPEKWNILGLKFKLESKWKNKEEIKFEKQVLNYDRPIFSRYNELLWRLFWQHTSKYTVSSQANGDIYLKISMDRFQEVVPAGDSVMERVFDVGIGGEIGFTFRMSF